MNIGSCTSREFHRSNRRGQPRKHLQIEGELSQFGGVIAGGTLWENHTRAHSRGQGAQNPLGGSRHDEAQSDATNINRVADTQHAAAQFRGKLVGALGPINGLGVTWRYRPIFFIFDFFFYRRRSSFAPADRLAMKLTNQSEVPVYTISGSNTARPLPEWLARRRKRSLKDDPEYANRVELLQDFEFEEASQCVRVSEDGEWVMSTGTNDIFIWLATRI